MSQALEAPAVLLRSHTGHYHASFIFNILPIWHITDRIFLLLSIQWKCYQRCNNKHLHQQRHDHFYNSWSHKCFRSVFSLAKVWSRVMCLYKHEVSPIMDQNCYVKNATSTTYYVTIPHALCWNVWYQTFTHKHQNELYKESTFLNFICVQSNIQIIFIVNFLFSVLLLCWGTLDTYFRAVSSCKQTMHIQEAPHPLEGPLCTL